MPEQSPSPRDTFPRRGRGQSFKSSSDVRLPSRHSPRITKSVKSNIYKKTKKNRKITTRSSRRMSSTRRDNNDGREGGREGRRARLLINVALIRTERNRMQPADTGGLNRYNASRCIYIVSQRRLDSYHPDNRTLYNSSPGRLAQGLDLTDVRFRFAGFEINYDII